MSLPGVFIENILLLKNVPIKLIRLFMNNFLGYELHEIHFSITIYHLIMSQISFNSFKVKYVYLTLQIFLKSSSTSKTTLVSLVMRSVKKHWI